MPEFQQDTYGLQDFHDAQLRHYGLKRDTQAPSATGPSSIHPAFRRNEATGMVPNAKPKRKPVPDAMEHPAPRTYSPSPPSPRTQTTEGTRLIFTRADGRFDPSTIKMDPTRYTPPSSPTTSSSRPASRSSNKPSLKRTDSSNSKSSWRSRRSSAEQVVRRFSTSLKEKADIVAMDRNERYMYIRNKHVASASEDAPAKSRPGRSGSITKSEKIALNISKVVDSIKPRRGSNDSAMSLGFTDVAPDGEMQPCVRCHRPIFDYATKGLCRQCHQEAGK